VKADLIEKLSQSITFSITGGTATKVRVAYSSVTDPDGGPARFGFRCYLNGARLGSGTQSVPLSGKTFNHVRCSGGLAFDEVRIRDTEGDLSASVTVEVVTGAGSIASGSGSTSTSTSTSTVQNTANTGSPEKIGTFVYDGK